MSNGGWPSYLLGAASAADVPSKHADAVGGALALRALWWRMLHQTLHWRLLGERGGASQY